MKITPVQTWANGQAKEATEFNLRIISDNLLDSATFYYSLSSEELSHLEPKTLLEGTEAEITTDIKVIDKYSEVVAEGNLTMDSLDYLAWGESADINAAAYVWGADKLNLVLVA